MKKIYCNSCGREMVYQKVGNYWECLNCEIKNIIKLQKG